MSSRALIVTALQMHSLEENVHGVYQRLRLFVEAACSMSMETDIMCLNPFRGRAEAGPDPQTVADIARVWGVKCRVFNGRCVRPRHKWPYMREQARWIASYRFSHPFTGFNNGVNAEMLDRLLDPAPQFVLAHKLTSMEMLDSYRSSAPIFFDLDDIEHVAAARHAEQLTQFRERLVAKAMVPAIRRAVRRSIRAATRTFVCSPLDAEFLQRTLGLSPSKTVVVPNSTLIRARSVVPEEPTLLFIGSFQWPPNAQAIDFFLNRCWARVRERVPRARLLVVGQSPERIAAFAAAPAGVEFTGFVSDIEKVYREARVVICPIISGGGTRVKLVEAAAFGKPIVSTLIGAEGLEFLDGRHAMMRDDAESFANACIQLLQNRRLCDQLSASVHQHASANFERTAVLQKIRATISDLTTKN